MTLQVGIGLAFVAMLCWGFGDFLLQRTTKKIGNWETLFLVTIFGVIMLLPFVYRNIGGVLFGPFSHLIILISAGVVLTIASLCILEAYKIGKLSVLEPILSFEIPTAALFALLVLGDQISWYQVVVIVLLMVGLCLVSFRETRISKEYFMEKGILLLFFGAAFMGVADFLLGWGARVTYPLMANFILDLVIAVISFSYLLIHGEIHKSIRNAVANRGLLLVTSISDKVAWIAYAFAMTLVPIAVATGLSESSTIVAVALGLVVNRDRLQVHQKVGLVLAITSAVVLAAITA